MPTTVASSSTEQDTVASTFSPELDFVVRVVDAAKAQGLDIDDLAEKVQMPYRELALQMSHPEIMLLGTARRLSTTLGIPMWGDAA